MFSKLRSSKYTIAEEKNSCPALLKMQYWLAESQSKQL